MRQEPKHIVDVSVMQQGKGRRDVQRQLRCGKIKFAQPCHVIIGAPMNNEEGYVGIYVESLASPR